VKLVETRRKAFGKDESVAVYWNNPDMQNLVDDCLNVRVLDPAMGSGHFLVEMVDYVSNRLIDFLNAWSENPVWAFLEKTRDDILNDMERQNVTIDADRLTRVSLLKRAVLKRCIYGVDLNGMAVELAKVSLWLDAFTLGAPMSFLDHHLKHGNSLIGARITDVQDYLRGGGGPQQIDMFSGSEFAGVMLATDLMRQVSYQPDNTIEQTHQSAQAYHDARDHLAPYKRLLDVYTSRWFSNSRYGTKKTDSLRLFLKDSQTKAWLRAPQTTLDDTLFPATDIAANALQAAEEKRFLHWELEFPEVFFAPSRPGGQDVQLKKDGGFNAVIGNPPYISTPDIAQDQRVFYRASFETCGKEMNTFALFSEQALRLSSNYNRLGYIVPDSYLYVNSYKQLRILFLDKCTIESIAEIPGGAFEDSTVGNSVAFVAERNENEEVRNNHTVKADIYISPGTLDQTDQFSQILFIRYPNRIFLTNSSLGTLLLQLLNNNSKLKDVSRLRDGVKTGNNTEFLSYEATSPLHKPVLSNSDIERCGFEWPGVYLLYDRDRLARPREEDIFLVPEKLIIRQTGDRLIAAYDNCQYYSLDNTRLLASRVGSLSPLYLLALINSRLLTFLHQVISGELDRAFAQVRIANLELLPIQLFKTVTSYNMRTQAVKKIEKFLEIDKEQEIITLIIHLIDSCKLDVVHDILVFLTNKMINLDQRKRIEIHRFLEWLNNKLGAYSDGRGKLGIYSFSGNQDRLFSDYMGDHERCRAPLDFRAKTNVDEFYYFLYKNRNRFAASLSDVEGEIEREYEKSLATLLPIKRELARTDALIDKIVYRLYGLRDEEIELIERPQYEQALADAKAQVVADEAITDDEEKIERIADGILPAARRFFERIEPTAVEELLDSELPTWRSLPPEAPTFLLTGDYNLRTLPDHMDFSTSVIPYTKAVEVVLSQLIFIPFRQQYTDADCTNDFLKKFMRGEKDLTLGSFMIILSSTRETALRNFIGRIYTDAARRVFGAQGFVTILNDEEIRDIRNKAAHDEILSRVEAQQMRSWAMQILGQV
jgi:hypothetical protein